MADKKNFDINAIRTKVKNNKTYYEDSGKDVFDFKNPAHLLNNIKVCISLSDILDEDQKEKFNFSAKSKLQILKNDIENRLNDPYILYNNLQCAILKGEIKEINALINLIENDFNDEN